MKKRPVFVACAAMFVATLALMPASAQRETDALGQRVDRPKMLRKGNQAIPQHYIVVLDVDAAGRQGNLSAARSTASDLAFRAGAEVTNVYAHALNGFSARMSDNQAVALADDPRVAFVEEDSMMFATVNQINPPWGLDRIDQRALPLNQTYSYTSTGSGVNAYIIDTGIRTTHTQFGGRASKVFDAIGDGQNGNDCNGHGTHVAGTVGGSTYGVAKAVRLFAVRVLSCSGSGSTSGVTSARQTTARSVTSRLTGCTVTRAVARSSDTALVSTSRA